MSKREVLLEIFKSYTEEDIEKYFLDNKILNIGGKMSQTIYLYLNNTIEETAGILGVTESTITRRINKFIKDYFS